MWIITEDRVTTGMDLPTRANRVKSNNFDAKAFKKMNKIEFRLLDDDHNVYYIGQMDKKTYKNGSEDEVGEPLDWAMYDAGACIMQVRSGKSWKTIIA